MRGMMTGLRPETFENLQLGAGVLMTGFAWRDGESADALRGRLAAFLKEGKGLLGAAKSGRFSCVPRLRAPEGAARNPYRGGWVTDGWDIRLSAVLMEITPGQFARALGCAQVERPQTGMTVVRPCQALSEEDYLPDLCWAGDMGRGCCLIRMENVLSVSGAALSFRERSEGEMPVVFSAHESGTGMDEPPCRIVFLE